MASPFQYFRKNSGTLMAITVVLSMFAFTLDSLFSADGANYPLLGLLAGAVILCLFGIRSGRILQFAAVGGVIGFAAGWILPGVMNADSNKSMQTALGTITKKDVDRMVQNRMVTNQFVRMIGGRGFDEFGFGSESVDRDVILGEMFRKEADRLGIVINDAAVNHFIRQASQNKMTAQQFKEVRQRFASNGQPLAEADLYDMLRDEMKARLASMIVVPFRGQDQPTADQYWDLYRRLNVSQEIVAASLPITAFVGQVADPAEGELTRLFEKYKTSFPNEVEVGSPGFRQPKKMQVACLEADYSTIESSLAAITDAEITKYYEDNKDREFTDTFLPDDVGPPEDSPSEGTAPADPDATPPGDTPDETPSTDGDNEPPPPAKPADSDDSSKDSDTNESCGPQEDDGVKEDGETASDTKATENTQTDPPADGDSTEKAEPIRYLPLTDEVKDDIRDRIKRERTLEALNQRSDAAVVKMRELADTYILEAGREAAAAEEEFEITSNAPKMAAEMKAWGEKNGLKYIETPLVSYLEFSNAEEYPIGSATEPVTDDFSNPNPDSVAIKLFNSPNRAVLYMPARAEDQLTNNQFAYWVTQEAASKIPEFDEKGIREQVVAAWKAIEARPIAKKRAEELKARVAAAIADGKTMSDALEGETITGQTEGVVMAVRNAPRFSWMRRPSTPAQSFMPQPPVISQVIGVDGAGRDFMKYIFEDLNDGEVGVVSNYDFSSYYIVQVINRTPSSEENLAKLRQEFMRGSYFDFFSPIAPMVHNERRIMNSNWTKRLVEKYNIDWNKFAAMSDEQDRQ